MLASPLIIDLVLTAEMMTRISWKSHSDGEASKDYKGFHSVLSILSYMLKVIFLVTVLPCWIMGLTRTQGSPHSPWHPSYQCSC